MVTPGCRVCDVGCDHGYVSIYLVQQKISPCVIAMDVRRGPLSRCEEHVARYGLEEYIESRLSDGLEKLKTGEVDAVVCAGMGGRLMQRILTEGQDIAAGLKELILQPQSELKAFREFLRIRGYRTVEENMIEEEGKFYPMMKVVPGERPIPLENSLYDRFGKLLLQNAHPVLYRYLQYRKEVLQAILDNIVKEGKNIESEVAGERDGIWEIKEELQDINRAFAFYEGRC